MVSNHSTTKSDQASHVLICLLQVITDQVVVTKEETNSNESEDDIDLLAGANRLLECDLLCLERPFLCGISTVDVSQS
jgi:hypothetical protein